MIDANNLYEGKILLLKRKIEHTESVIERVTAALQRGAKIREDLVVRQKANPKDVSFEKRISWLDNGSAAFSKGLARKQDELAILQDKLAQVLKL